jgi:hypothetical protein
MKDLISSLLANSTFLKILGVIGGVLLVLLVIAIKHYWPDADSTLLGILAASGVGLLTATGVYHAVGARQAQSGRSSLGALFALVGLALSLALLQGCSTTATSWYAGMEAKAHTDLARALDAAKDTQKDLLCDTPASVLQRDLKWAQAREDVCGPIPTSGGQGIQPSQVSDILRAARGLPAASGAQ